MNRTDIADYVAANVLDSVSRVPGVGELTLFGSQYAMRIWLDPNKLISYKLTPGDVANAIRAQNAQIATGQLGGLPAVPGQRLNATISAQGRLQTPAQFEAIVLRTEPSGATVRVRDVARVELGGENYGTVSFYKGNPSSGLAVRLAAGANALATADAVKAKVAELERFFPPGLKAVVAYDTTPFIRLSIEEVVKTLIEAFVLVFLVMYVFLQNLRATLIPAIAVPVVLLGTFAVMLAFGFSINVLTMFGVVLAIGLLVDDAIVVVENVERLMSEEGLSPKEATRKSMGQITGALVGIALVLAAVFIPMAFFGGSTGVIYRQFSITMASSMALSVVVALILSPALCATLLTPMEKGSHGATRGFFGWFNRFFERGSSLYQRIVGRMLHSTGRWLAAYAVMLALAAFLLVRLPTSFLPDEDQGILFAQVILPPGRRRSARWRSCARRSGTSCRTRRSSAGVVHGRRLFVFRQRPECRHRLRAAQGLEGATRRAQQRAGRRRRVRWRSFRKLRDATVFAFAPPAVLELGVANGFDMYLQDRGGCRPRGADRCAEPVAGPRGEGARAQLGAAERTRGHAAVQRRHRHRACRCAGVIDGRYQRHAVGGLGQRLRERFHRQGPREEGLSAVRCPVPHGSGGPGQMVCAQCAGRHGAVFDVRARPLDVSARRGSNASTARPPSRSRGRRRRAAVPAKRWQRWNGWWSSCRPDSASRGPGCPTRSGSRARRRRCSTGCRSSSCSCALRRSMKAGRFRLRCC